MNLRSGKPVSLAPPLPKLPRSELHRARRTEDFDVAIIGAGITGALVAHALVEAKLRVVVFDKRDPGRGSTAASTGLLLYEPDMMMADIAQRHGRAAAERVYALGQQAIRELQRIVRREKIDCRWRSRRSLYIASRHSHVATLRRELKDRVQAGLPVQWLQGERLDRICPKFPAALAASGAGEVDALRLTLGLLRRCQRNEEFALRVPVRVRRVDETDDGVSVRTNRGTVRARFAVVATGYETRGFLSHRLVRLNSTFVIASAKRPTAQLRRLPYLMWETARPYFYLRTTADRRILFGGLDDPYLSASRRARKLPKKARELQRLFAELFPSLAFEPEFAWAGAFADTTDGLPCIGPRREGSRVLFALGYGGNGITFSQIAAKLLTERIVGRRNPDERLFAFRRQNRERRSASREGRKGR